MKYYNFFNVSELFLHNSDDEILECVKSFRIDNLLILLMILDQLREFIQSPVVVNSAFRNELHNKSVGGVDTSQHLLGEAVDISFPKMYFPAAVSKVREFFEKSAFVKFVGQVLIYQNFIHIGLRTQSHKHFFIYDKRKSKSVS